MRYIVFLGLPKEIEHKIDVVRKKFQAKSLSLWSSHITIKYDEDYALREKTFAKIVEHFYSNIKAINILVEKPKIVFMNNPVRWNIYLPVTSNYLRSLVRQFSKSVEKFIDTEAPGALTSTRWEQSNAFQLHISLKGGMGKKEGQRTYNEMLKQDFSFEFPSSVLCSSVVIARWDMKRWKKVSVIKLK